MASGYATYSGEEVEARFSASAVQTDYGVPRSPVWTEFEDIEIEEVTILGVKVDPKALPPDLVEAIRALANELEFEVEEPAYD